MHTDQPFVKKAFCDYLRGFRSVQQLSKAKWRSGCIWTFLLTAQSSAEYTVHPQQRWCFLCFSYRRKKGLHSCQILTD